MTDEVNDLIMITSVIREALGPEMKTPEGKVKDEIRKFLKDQGAYVFSPVQMGYGASTLDLLVCWKGRFVAIEVKAPGKNITDRQVTIAEQIKNAGGLSFVTWDLQKVKVMLGYV